MGRTLLAAWVVMTSLPASALAEQDAPLHLRVLTYNVWGIPVITPHLAERMQRIPRAIAELNPDIVALEEVWSDEDAATLRAGLEAIGLRYIARDSPEWPNQNGLMIASRYPLHGFHFKRFSQGRHPHWLWHVDYLSGKGVAQVQVETPIGPIGFAATHLQASYGSEDYLFVQMSQALEAASELNDRSHPFIFAGDVNSRSNGLPARLLTASADLVPTDPEADIDQILFRDGTFVRAEMVSVKKVLTDPVELGADRIPLSDHPGVLAELELIPCDGRCRPSSMTDRLEKLEAEVLPMIDGELAARDSKMTRDLIVALLLPIAGLLLLWWRRRSLGRPCLKSRTVACGMVVGAFWFAYLHTSYGPAHIAGLLNIRGRMAASAFSRAHASTAVLSRGGS